MTDAPTLEPLRRRKQRWLLLLWSCGALFALSTIVGLGASLTRVRKTVEMADALSESAYEAMIEDTLLRMQMGLLFGTLTFLCYLSSAIMHHRAKKRLQRALDEHRHRAILDELGELGEETRQGTGP
mgnify:CR=1 FL=1